MSPEKSHRGQSLKAAPLTKEGALRTPKLEQQPACWVLVPIFLCFKPERWWAHWPAWLSRSHPLPGSCYPPPPQPHPGSPRVKPWSLSGPHSLRPAAPRSSQSYTHPAGPMPQPELTSVLVFSLLASKSGCLGTYLFSPEVLMSDLANPCSEA